MVKRLALLLAVMLAIPPLMSVAEDAQIGYINEDTKIYMDASEKAIVDGNASLGMQVRVEEEKASEGLDWYRVTFLANSHEGWVKADDVDLVIAKKPIVAVAAPEVTPGGVQPVERESDFPVLTASGAIDPDLLPGAPKADQYRTLETGDAGEDVEAVIQRLYALGYLESGNAKKLMKTHQSAIRQFQKNNGLTQDGVCSPELQAKLFSDNALNKRKEKLGARDALLFSKGTVKASNKGGGTITYTLKNTTASSIDAYNINMRLYNTYGERFLMGGAVSDFTLADELTVLEHVEERATFRKNETISFAFEMGSLYFAGVMIAVTAYHVQGGETVRIPEDQLHWFGFGKGVTEGYQDLLVTPLTDEETKLAGRWEIGVDGAYVDADIAKQYGVREGFLIQKMTPASMLDEAGLKAGDVLLAIGDIRIFGKTSIERALSRLDAGQDAVVLFLRNGVVYQTRLVTPGGIAAA